MRKTPQRRRGRPALGDGAARVLFTIDPDLLTRLDAFASARGMKRSRLIALSVELYMGAKPGRDKRDAHAGHATVNSVPGSKSTSLAAMAG
jgi:metal-responsive CopG/Arc/MetJ family transcriptional regulator